MNIAQSNRERALELRSREYPADKAKRERLQAGIPYMRLEAPLVQKGFTRIRSTTGVAGGALL